MYYYFHSRILGLSHRFDKFLKHLTAVKNYSYCSYRVGYLDSRSAVKIFITFKAKHGKTLTFMFVNTLHQRVLPEKQQKIFQL
jgi:hypothetical protein